MTSNQINYARAANEKAAQIRENEENRRSNRAKESENFRSNVAREKENRRSNVVKELLSLGNLVMSGINTDKTAASKLAGVLGNDPSWYNLNRNLVDSSANINFEGPLRKPITIDGVTQSRAGLLALNWIPAIGGDSISAGKQRPIIIAAQTIYAWVRHANSGASNYEPNDLMMYLLAMDSAYTWYAFGRMIYRMCLSATSYNLNFPEVWFKAIGINRESFHLDLANFRYYLDTCALRLNALNVPAKFPYFDRHVWMVSNIFKDSDLDKTAYYYYAPAAYGLYDSVKGYVGFNARPNELNFSNYKVAMDNILAKLYGSEDIGIISGDIKKAYGDALFKIESTPMDDVAVPFYSMEVLQQINNTIMVGHLTSGSYDIFQVAGDQNSIFQGTYDSTPEKQVKIIKLPNNNKTHITEAIINMSSNVPSVDDIMVATRNCVTTKTSSGAETYEYIDTCGSEIFTTGVIASITFDSSSTTTVVNVNELTTMSGDLNAAVLSCQLDWAPHIRYKLSDNFKYLFLYDLENYAIVSAKELENMHTTALLSEFYIPGEGLKNIGSKVPR